MPSLPSLPSLRWSLLVAVLLAGNVVTAVLALKSHGTQPGVFQAGGGSEPLDSPRFRELEASIARLETAIHALETAAGGSRQPTPSISPAATSARDAESATSSTTRLDALEQELDELAAAFDAFEVRTATGAERPDFSADDGFLNADALVEAGKHSAAAEGYLEFLDNHPDHVDYHDIAHKARRALLNAGYVDRAIDLQKELVDKFPDKQEENYSTLATMEKNAGRYDEAIEHLGASIERTAHKETKLWRLMFQAWYVQLRDGDTAGLQAYRDVDRIRQSMGVDYEKIKTKLADKMEIIEARLAAEER